MLHISSTNICVFSVDRSPSGNFVYWNTSSTFCILILSEFNICGDVNINCLNQNYKKQQLDGTVYFPMRIQTHSTSAVDSIFIG